MKRPVPERRLWPAVLLGLTALLTLTATATEGEDPISAAVRHPDRSAADRLRDSTSHPEAVLRFLGVQPGMVVFDFLGGAGYYSELLTRVVGAEGQVYLHNNQGYQGLMRGLPRRLQGRGMDSLTVYVREIEDINLPSNTVDLVLMVKVYHDFYYLNNGWAVRPEAALQTVHRILKPGGLLGIIDHRAPDGSGSSFAQNLHRISADFTRADMESHGFRFDGASQVLANPIDDLLSSPFQAELRGRTDRFLHRYVKVTPGTATQR